MASGAVSRCFFHGSRLAFDTGEGSCRFRWVRAVGACVAVAGTAAPWRATSFPCALVSAQRVLQRNRLSCEFRLLPCVLCREVCWLFFFTNGRWKSRTKKVRLAVSRVRVNFVALVERTSRERGRGEFRRLPFPLSELSRLPSFGEIGRRMRIGVMLVHSFLRPLELASQEVGVAEQAVIRDHRTRMTGSP
jgi:hypothetical protein